MDEELFRIDRNAISFSTLANNDSDRRFWLSKTAVERLQAVELLRILMYGYDPATERLQRVFETAEFKTS
ncbi:MAG: hypothetical protein A2315_07680 [Ignavibacteria bacterium RIFOXYB2_FULL_35_12]|nr:MAG: hypothetical protein A2058_01815 [Ignavibacteria bacterium GWA2_36_19]OGU50186.1 MAG: hypothetical protein A2006_15435 [Ignavibacteria bacterium GWC2_35_8]OGU60389.1 MAG: hypothetical protein A2X60_02890 [Ignavibacteria bacterium GWF2_35_20]OGU78250.1 MAG: hypothetical protein A2254_12730 [Ignavibacteria bacterium RIFOXYA2_FULL_35_9]OGU82297.1 MAG: hypothetical protein A2W11_12560 [Ignavibacteria bacterium RBG_16_35_7]OGU84287.1 MAG: hypothetical protein A3K31_15420 [Ignavibacteria bac